MCKLGILLSTQILFDANARHCTVIGVKVLWSMSTKLSEPTTRKQKHLRSLERLNSKEHKCMSTQPRSSSNWSFSCNSHRNEHDSISFFSRGSDNYSATRVACVYARLFLYVALCAPFQRTCTQNFLAVENNLKIDQVYSHLKMQAKV